MAHLAKHTRAAVGHMCAHYDRSASNIGNEDITPERTPENYNLAPDRPDTTQTDFIQQRCAEARTLNRKDVNVMCSWVVTAPKDLPQADEQKFFKSTYDFLNERYGGEKNVVSAYVHMDEKRPHMHYAFVPAVLDEKRGGERVSAHDAVNRGDLKSFHTDLSRYLEREFGRNIGVLNGATAGGNQTLEELKANTKIAESQLRALEASRMASEAQARMDKLKAHESDLRGKIEGMERDYGGRVLTQKGLDQIQPKKGALGAVKDVSLEDIQDLKQTAQKYHDAKNENESLKRDNNALRNENAELRQRVPSINQKLKEAANATKLENIERVAKDVAKQKPELAKIVNAIANGRNPLEQGKNLSLSR